MMNWHHIKTIGLLLLLAAGFWAAPTARAEAASNGAAIEVTVGIAPLAYLVKQIGGERVRVTTLITPGQDPHSFEPNPGQLAGLSRTGLYFSLNMPFERTLLNKIARGPGAPRVIEVDRGIAKLPLPEHHHHHDGEGHKHHEKAHAHGEPDPHVWLNPELLPVITGHILAGLSAADPGQAALYRRNHDRLRLELEQLHARLSDLLAPLAGRTFFVYHPAFGYFADAYGLRQQAVEIAGKSPTPRQLISLIDQARHDGVRVIFVQPQFDRKSAAAVARAIDGAVVPLDPLAEDVPANLAEMAERIHRALADQDRQPDGNRSR